MKTFIFYCAFAFLTILTHKVQAQGSAQDQISELTAQKEKIKETERNLLKQEVESINKRLDEGEITFDEARNLKKESATKRARNIEDQLQIIDHKIALVERNMEEYEELEEDSFLLRITSKGTVVNFKKRDSIKSIRYDRRTYSDIVVAIGLNNAIIKGQSLDDSPYKIGGSRFFELGWAWRTRVFDNTNWLRIKYGFSFQFNGLKPLDNQYFVEDGEVTQLETFPINLDKSKFRMDNLVLPVHFEIGPSKKREGENYVRYYTDEKFKIGLGGYAGLNLLTIQKLKYDDANGNDQKEKQKRNFNTNNFIYGLSGYVAFGDVALYLKYDLNTLFKDNPVEQRNVSLGLRFDMD